MRTKYYHGGVSGLGYGRMILPSQITGAACTADYGGTPCKRDKVYVCTDLDAAKLYAAMHPSGKGKVYEVSPIGELVDDPDCIQPGLSFECDRARVLWILPFSDAQRIYYRQAVMASL